MDPNEALHRSFARANLEDRNGPQPSPISVRWTCSDCGKRRSGYMRNVCARCSADVCDWCRDRHVRQHPREALR